MKTNKPWLVFSLSLLAVTALADPPTIKINPEKALTEYRVVGFTQTETTGRVEADGGALIGYAAMHKLCTDEVAPNARAAFSAEALRTPPLAGAPDVAWVIPSSLVPVFRPDAFDDNRDWTAVDSATGATGIDLGHEPISGTHNVTCVDYTNSEGSRAGMAWRGRSGLVAISFCSSAIPIVCSVPVAIPVSVYSE